jgi:hypothetical protein
MSAEEYVWQDGDVQRQIAYDAVESPGENTRHRISLVTSQLLDPVARGMINLVSASKNEMHHGFELDGGSHIGPYAMGGADDIYPRVANMVGSECTNPEDSGILGYIFSRDFSQNPSQLYIEEHAPEDIEPRDDLEHGVTLSLTRIVSRIEGEDAVTRVRIESEEPRLWVDPGADIDGRSKNRPQAVARYAVMRALDLVSMAVDPERIPATKREDNPFRDSELILFYNAMFSNVRSSEGLVVA